MPNGVPMTEAERLYATLRERVVRGELKPGTRLVHRRIAQEFGTSNIPVIDAIRRLVGDGLVEDIPLKGAVVRRWTLDDIKALFRVRQAAEGQAAFLFAERASRMERVMLVELAHDYETAYDTGGWESRVAADVAFHGHLVEHSGSDYLVHLARSTGLISQGLFSRFGGHTPVNDRSPVREHHAIAQAAAAQEAEEADRLCGDHVRASLGRFLEAAAGELENLLRTQKM